MLDIENIVRDIRKCCRLAMNGVTSTSMREHGLQYKLNFGLLIPQIKHIATTYTPNKLLAETLWNDNTRELKIMATMLYPSNEFPEELADKWVQEIPNQEIREQVCANLFQNLPFALNRALCWANDESAEIRTTGYWLLSRLLLTKKSNITEMHTFNYIWSDIIQENYSLRNAALLLLKHLGRQSQIMANDILKKVSIYKNDENLIKQETYNSIAFEFEYYFE